MGTTRTTIAAALLVLGGVGAADAQESHRVAGDRVAIYNLAGRVDVVEGSGPDVVVRLTRGGSDAAQLGVETGIVAGRGSLRVLYPGDAIVYPRLGRGSRTRVRVRENGTFFDDRGRGGVDVSVRGSGDGLEAWADLRVEVPRGRDVEVYLAVGDVGVSGVDGALAVETGSGAVDVAGMRGRLSVDTGSGSVTVADVDGEVGVDTGSGSVELSRVRGPSVLVDTGSGGVRGSDIVSARFRVDTGSGSIRADGVASSDVSLDTGSGSVEVELLEDVEILDIDTGSGSVIVRVPAGVGAEIEAETGSGGIDVDLPVEVRSVKRDYLLGRIGDGRGRIHIDTGSGGIRLVSGL